MRYYCLINGSQTLPRRPGVHGSPKDCENGRPTREINPDAPGRERALIEADAGRG